MKIRIARISIHQTSKTLAFLYGLLALVIMPFGMLMSTVAPVDESVPAILWLVFPPLYTVLAYVGFAILGAIYNLIAKSAGGVEFQMEETGLPGAMPS